MQHEGNSERGLVMNTQLKTVDMFLPLGSVEAYIQRIKLIPLISAEKERALAIRFSEQHDLEAARYLVLTHLRFVVSIARKYLGYGLPLADIIQEGNMGLMKAVKRFNPRMGIRLITFAVHWIKAEIHEFILRNWRIVKVATTKAQRKLFFNLRQMKKHLGWLSSKETQMIAKSLHVSEKTVTEMDERMHSQDEAFEIVDEEKEDAARVPALYLADPHSDPAYILEKSELNHNAQHRLITALEQLDERSKRILEARWLSEKKTTLQDLAKQFRVSIERIRQIEKHALTQLKSLAMKAV